MTGWTGVLKPGWKSWLAVALLLVLFAQLATSATIKSPVFDEPLHTARAYYVMATGDWRMQAGHPPLLYRLLGPLFWILPQRPALQELTQTEDHVEMAREIIRALDRPLDVLILPLRVVVMGSTLVLGATLYRWAGERHGAPASLLALFVYAFSPNVLAHGRLVTTDLLLSCFYFLAVYTFQRLLQRPAMGRCLAAGVSLGLALGSKASALLLVPVFFVLVLMRSAALKGRPTEDPREAGPLFRRFLFYTALLIVTALIAGVVLWFLYGLEIGPWGEGWPSLPLESYIETLLQVQEHGGGRGHPAFLMGERSGGGWLAYFPIALALKTPLPTLIGAVIGTAWLLLQRRWWAWLTAFLPAALLFTVASFSSLNIGYRHILPVVPFLILLVSSLTELPWRRPLVFVVGASLSLWLVAGTLRVYPDYLTSFNALAGGPDGGHRYLTDSNLDWGQDLIQLRDYLEEHSIEEVYLSYFGNVDPRAYGIQYEPLPSHFSVGEVEDFTPFAPPPGFYAISVTNLSGQFLVENPSVLDWFNHREPVASIGHSINLYRVPPDPSPPTWVGMCQAPSIPLDGEAFARKVGRDDVRLVRFDCQGSWMFAKGGEPGWFVVPATDGTRDVTPPAGSWLTAYEQENYDGKLLFTVYRWEAQEALSAHLRAIQTAQLSSHIGEVLELLGSEVKWASNHQSQVAVGLRNYWRVLTQPERPLSLMAHLVDQDGRVVAVGDALDVPVEDWAPGDIIVQEHRLGLDSTTDLEGVHIELGAYWLPSLERLPTFDRTGAPLIGDVIRLTETARKLAR